MQLDIYRQKSKNKKSQLNLCHTQKLNQCTIDLHVIHKNIKLLGKKNRKKISGTQGRLKSSDLTPET